MINSVRSKFKKIKLHQLRILALVVAGVLWIGPAHAQSVDRQELDYIPFQASYLSSIKNVEDIVQDSSGFIWLTSNYGLIRLDGRSAVRYNKFNSAILKSNNFFRNLEVRESGLTFLRDELGNFYLPDGYGGLIAPDSSKGILKRLLKSELLMEALAKRAMVFAVNAREAWVSEYPGFVQRFQGADFYQTSIVSSYGISSGFFTYLNGHLWFNRNGQVFRIIGDSVALAIPKGISDAKGGMWLFHSGHRKLVLFSNGKLFRCSVDSSGNLTANQLKGIQINQQVTSVYEDDRTGFIYVGSSAGGLQIFQPRRFTHISTTQLPVDQTAFFYTPLIYSKDNVLANIDRTLFLFTGKKAELVYKENPDFNYTTLFKDRIGRVWFEPSRGRVVALNPLRKDQNFQTIYDFKDEVRHILEFKGKVYVLTNSVLYRMVEMSSGSYRAEASWILFREKPQGISLRTNTVHFTDENQVLIGYTSGLLKLNLGSGAVEVVSGFSKFNVRALEYVDGLGLMAGTYGDGYFLIKDFQAVPMPVDPAGALNSVHAFVRDKFGFLWMPTNEGLIRVRTSDLAKAAGQVDVSPGFQRFTELDGLISDEFNGGTNPAYGLRGDTLVLPSSKGLTFLRTSDFGGSAQYPLSVFLTYGNQRHRTGRNFEISSSEAIRIDFERFHASPAGVEVVWYRVGPKGPWKRSEITNQVFIDQLWRGTYVLEFSTVDPLLGIPDDVVRIQLKVNAVWYETTLFWLVVLFLFVGLIWALIQLRTNAILAQRRSLQEEVNAKTEELHQINLQLEEKNLALSNSMAEIREQIAFREKVLLVLLHDLKSPMRFVASTLRRLYTQLRPESRERALSGEVVTSVSGIYKFMEDFHNWVIQNNTEQLKLEYISISSLFASIQEFYEQIAVVYGNTLVVKSEDIILKTYGFTLKTIVGNLVDNALKNTTGGTVMVIAFDSNSYVNLSVSDTGRGMTEEQVSGLLEQFDSNQKMVTPSIGGGAGYSIISAFLKRVGGLISIKSIPGRGTTVIISIPKSTL